jgi:hypothetical protein
MDGFVLNMRHYISHGGCQIHRSLPHALRQATVFLYIREAPFPTLPDSHLTPTQLLVFF